jgi:hypothetical protein
MRKINENGFTAIEILLIFLVVAIIGVAGYIVIVRHQADNHNNIDPGIAGPRVSNSSVPKSTQPANPYAGWQTYSLQYEKVSLKYPPGWSLINANKDEYPNPSSLEQREIADQDQILINGPNGYVFNMETGNTYNGASTCIVTSQPITTLGQSLFLVFEGGYTAGCITTGNAVLLMKSGDQNSFVEDRNSNPANGAPGNQMDVSITFPSQIIKSLQSDSNYQKELLILKSMSY